MRIAVDAFGGDHAPEAIVKGCVQAVSECNAELILVGKEQILAALLEHEDVPTGKIHIHHAEEVIETSESPVDSIRRKKDSSLVVGLELVKNGEADAVVSAGNTGAYLAGAFRTLGRVKGVKRPALTTVLPTVGNPGVILDVGANADCRPLHLVQFAQMGAIYAEHVLGIQHPRVGLLNIGAEEAKGNALTKETHQLLKSAPVNFIGNIEPRDVPYGLADVIVCDGFTGNVVIKLIEGTASALFSMMKDVFYKSTLTKLAAGILKPGLKTVKSRMDYSEYGGAPLLGIDGVVFKAHGSSDAKAIKNAVKTTALYVEAGVNEKIKAAISAYSTSDEDEDR
ncbi:MAG: phosphate acyltransferase PlsX [Ruminococcaceae bacterium]|nr:phosphate acyltransferase PlsX [Oscillospiraceae bacterium]